MIVAGTLTGVMVSCEKHDDEKRIKIKQSIAVVFIRGERGLKRRKRNESENPFIVRLLLIGQCL
jgi:hypothetical protein